MSAFWDHAQLEVANYGDLSLMQRGVLPPDQVRRETIQGIVETSNATQLAMVQGVRG